jgi:hypothetical protein
MKVRDVPRPAAPLAAKAVSGVYGDVVLWQLLNGARLSGAALGVKRNVPKRGIRYPTFESLFSRAARCGPVVGRELAARHTPRVMTRAAVEVLLRRVSAQHPLATN